MPSSQAHVVIAAYNEAAVIGEVVRELIRADYRVIVVDDGSSDRTADVARTGGATVLRHPINLGQGAALQTAMDYAIADGAQYVVTFDADGQHRAADIVPLLEPLRLGQAHFVLGTRFLGQAPHMPSLRRLLLKAATLFTRLTIGIAVSDTHNGLRAMTRRGALAIRLRQNRMAHASEFLAQVAASGLRFVECPVSIDYSAYSLGKGQKATDAFAVLLDLFASRLYH